MAGNIVEYIIKIDTKRGKISLQKLSGDLKQTQRDLDKTGKKGKAAMTKLALGAKKARAAMAGLKSGLTSVGISAGLAGAGMFALMKQQADYVNQLNDTATRTGIAIDTLAGLKLAAEGSGKSFESVERGLDQFIPKLSMAANESSRTGQFFKSLGISVTDAKGNLRDANSVFNETVTQLGRITDQTTQNAFAFELFGRQAGGALIQSGALNNLDAFIEKAEAIGPALDEGAIKKAAEFQKGWAELKTGVLGAIGDILTGLTGEESIGKAMSNIAHDMKYYAEAIVKWFKWIGESIQPVVDTFMVMAEIVKGDMDAAISKALIASGAIPDISKKFGERRGMGETYHTMKGGSQADAMFADLVATDFMDEGLEKKISGYKARKGDSVSAEGLRQRYKDLASKYVIFESGLKITDDNFRYADDVLAKINEEMAREGMGMVPLTAKEVTPKRTDTLKGKIGKNKPGDTDTFVPFVPTTKDTKDTKDFAGAQEELFDIFEHLATEIPQLTNEFESLNQGIDKTAEQIVKAMEKGDFDTEKMLDKVESLSIGVNDLKDEYTILGYDGSEAVSPLINKLVELGQQAEEAAKKTKKLSDIKMGIDISATMVDIAGGNIVGGAAGIVSQLAPALGPVVGSVAALAGSLESLGNQLIAAEDAALQAHIDRLIERQEDLLNRGLSDEEKKAIADGLSNKQIEQIKKEAREAMVRDNAEQMTQAIVLGLTELPLILMEILPPLVLKAAYEIVKAIALLPGRMIGALGKGIVDWFKMLGQIIKDAITLTPGEVVDGVKNGVSKAVGALKGLVGLGDDKRTGGRFISARSGIRYTGMSDGLAMLHRNEFVVPESGARPQAINRIMQGQQSGGGITINVNADIVERNAVEELVRKIERQFLDFGTAKSTLF